VVLFLGYIFIVGTAGSGKSTLTDALADYIAANGLTCHTMNLDPGVRWLPYYPDVDVREYVNYEDVMTKLNLGPNGGLIACTDMIAEWTTRLKEEAEEGSPDYILVDTPGQMEIFAFRSAGPHIIRSLADHKSMILYLFDPFLSKTSTGFVSVLLLSVSIQYRFFLPQLNVLSKTDMVSREDVERILGWTQNYDMLLDAIEKEAGGTVGEINTALCHLLGTMSTLSGLIPTSAVKADGLDLLYTEIDRILQEL